MSSRTGRRLATLVCALAILVGGRAVAAPQDAPTNPTAGNVPPAVVPALDHWRPGTGSWTLTDETRIVAPSSFRAQADMFAKELSIELDPSLAGTALTPPRPGAVPIVQEGATAADIAVRIEPSRTDALGAESYDLHVGADGVRVVAADVRGAFYGTRSLSQMLRQTRTLPAGDVTDKPLMRERGVTLCACRINIQTDFIDRLLMDMADLKLNYLMLELKVKSDDPRDNSWSYYTPDDVRSLVERASDHGIEVFPVINAPGHMGAWLANRPDLQLKDRFGKAHETRLDITKPEALQFYTGIIDSYADIFPSDSWHMGADEYLIGTNGPSQFPDVARWARAEFGPDATLYDAFNHFVNNVNTHVKQRGKTLRMWNDGIHPTTEVQLDDDIVIEYWSDTGVHATDLTDRGYELMNASQALYFSRSARNYKVNSAALWENGWHAGQFDGGTTVPVDSPALRGAKVSIWPDISYHQTENEVEEEVFDSLRLVSQLTWNANHKGNDGQEQSWQQFKAAVDAVGHHPLWQNVVREPLPEGTYRIGLTRTDGQPLVAQDRGVALGTQHEDWAITKSPDHYYQLRHEATGRCLALREGRKDLGVVIETGARPQLERCVDITKVTYGTGERGNPQKWQLIPANGGFTIRNALTNQDLAAIRGTEQAIDFSANPATDKDLADQSKRPDVGTVVQLPHDLTDDVWRFAGRAGATATIIPAELSPGAKARLVVTLRAPAESALRDVVVRPVAVAGLSIRPTAARVGTIAAGTVETTEFDLYTDGTVWAGEVPVEVAHRDGTLRTAARLSTRCGERVTPTGYSASSEELHGEGPVNGHVKAAFDGNPATFWHTQWEGAEPAHPHTVTMDLGETQELCAFDYLPRESGNGRITGYEIHVSDDGETWGEPVATGTFGTDAEWQSVPLDHVTTRYVRLTTRAAVTADDRPGAVWASAAELAVTRVETPLPVPSDEPPSEPSPEPTASESPLPEPSAVPSKEPSQSPTPRPTPSAPVTELPSPAPTADPMPTPTGAPAPTPSEPGAQRPSAPRPGLPATGA
ncbi:family 20 glycosylhydrolase [uncultured Tessaracoccus sp.]|uniref:family 20 glycosylhydrolase n=1 Tax=uncultured Tessaracoccus sp. TaxID=905023 RepID=UPI0025CC5139|nr:family 20 glycosylhydrolase [uncultured Tessaracoccus sp.]